MEANPAMAQALLPFPKGDRREARSWSRAMRKIVGFASSYGEGLGQSRLQAVLSHFLRVSFRSFFFVQFQNVLVCYNMGRNHAALLRTSNHTPLGQMEV
jgi:hypothetical protein